MNEKTNYFISAVLILLVVACFALVYKASTRDYVINQAGGQGLPQVTAQGNAELEIMPDEAEVRIALETKAKTAKAAQDQNSQLMSNVQSALKQAGVRSDKIESVGYNIYPEQEWDPVTGRSKETGYRVYHVLKVTTDDIEKIGTFAQVAVDAGANRIEGINFRLSKTLEKQVKEEAIKQASVSAKEKAEAIAGGLGVRLGELLSVSESSFGWGPVYRDYGMAEMSKGGSDVMPAPSVEPEMVNVNAQISVVYRIG